ncbi:MAG: hypothetical protein KDJ87_07850 [Rhizobiaceae bacterium]|nr:hypothetical protein [Rhizobiaceae bacterium]
MRRRLAAIAFPVLAAMPATAFATGGVGCAIDDGNLQLDFDAAFSYSDIGGVFQARGILDSRMSGTYETLKKMQITDADIRQQWFRGDDLKLMIYRETEGDGVPHAFVKLIVETTKPPEEDFAYGGSYVLTIQPAVVRGDEEAVTVEGKVTCSAG